MRFHKQLLILCTIFLVIGLTVLENATFPDKHGRRLSEQGNLTLSLFPLRPTDYIGFAAAVVALVISAGGGIGGGGLLVPIFILVLRFPVKHAVGLSNVTVFGGAVANTALNASKRHPLVNRPLVDWNLLSMMEPLTMAGALIGAELNKVLPDIAVVIMLVLLLGVTAIRTLRKANQMYAAETADRGDEKEAASLIPLTTTGENCSGYGTNENGNLVSMEESTPELVQLLQQEAKVPWNRVWQLSALFLTVVVLNLVKGGGGSQLMWLPFEITCGSNAFVTLEVANIVIIVLFAIHVRQTLIEDTAKKHSLAYEFVKGDVVWDETNTWKYSCICSLAGLVAGLFGIGGGIIKSPLLLEMGVHPAVASATSSTMILFTSFTATTSYMVYGELNYQYAAVCVVVGFLCTAMGQGLMQLIMAKHKRNSYIAYSVALVVGVSTIAMSLESFLSLSQGYSGSHRSGGMCQ